MVKVVTYNPSTNDINVIEVNVALIPRDYLIWGWDHFEQCPIYAAPGTPQIQGKFDSNGNHARKVIFESKLALAVLENYQLFIPLLHKIGGLMVQFLEEGIRANKQNEAFIASILCHHLYTDKPHFGRLGAKLQNPNPTAVIEVTKTILTQAKKIEHLFTAYLGIYDVIRNVNLPYAMHTVFHDFKRLLFVPELFHNRGRYRSRHAAPTTSMFGIVARENRLPAVLEAHTRAVDAFRRDKKHPSLFAQDAALKEIPFVAGPSGHTAALLCVALTMLKSRGVPLPHSELQTLTLAISGYLIAAGAHSFHEVFSVAKQIGVDYQIGRYEVAIGPEFAQTPRGKALFAEFPDIVISNSHEKINQDTDAMQLDNPFFLVSQFEAINSPLRPF